MLLTELFPTVKSLPRADKLRLMQFLVVELAQEEGVSLLTAGAEYPVWTAAQCVQCGRSSHAHVRESQSAAA